MKYAMVFPGQGSQSIGMLDPLADHPLVKKIFTQAQQVLGYDLWQLVAQGPVEKLNQTEFTQPALLAANVARWRVLVEQTDLTPAFLAGHSLGEYAALVCAGSIIFEDAILLVANRGKYMQQAVAEGEGTMAAIIGLTDEQVVSVCQDAAQGEIISPANFNSKGQVVVAGQTAAVNRAIQKAKEVGAKIAKLIPVSVPSHCALMQSAAKKLAKDLADIDIVAPEIPVIHNFDVKRHQDVEQIREALTQQLVSPVRWVETIEYFAEENVECVIECGPGKVLTGLNKRINKELTYLNVSDPDNDVSLIFNKGN